MGNFESPFGKKDYYFFDKKLAIWEKKREIFLGDQKKKVLCEKYNVWFTFLAQETSSGGGGDGCGGDRNGNGSSVEGSGRGGAKDLMQALMNPVRNI